MVDHNHGESLNNWYNDNKRATNGYKLLNILIHSILISKIAIAIKSIYTYILWELCWPYSSCSLNIRTSYSVLDNILLLLCILHMKCWEFEQSFYKIWNCNHFSQQKDSKKQLMLTQKSTSHGKAFSTLISIKYHFQQGIVKICWSLWKFAIQYGLSTVFLMYKGYPVLNFQSSKEQITNIYWTIST